MTRQRKCHFLDNDGAIPDFGYLFLCETCGEYYTHQYKVEVFFRNEDAQTGLHAVIETKSYHVDNDMRGNPSPRRDGISISFWCENCESKTVLDIIQRKGSTYLQAWGDGRASDFLGTLEEDFDPLIDNG